LKEKKKLLKIETFLVRRENVEVCHLKKEKK
jgi:hypothetical protein